MSVQRDSLSAEGSGSAEARSHVIAARNNRTDRVIHREHTLRTQGPAARCRRSRRRLSLLDGQKNSVFTRTVPRHCNHTLQTAGTSRCAYAGRPVRANIPARGL
jgi:hypothetical protein